MQRRKVIKFYIQYALHYSLSTEDSSRTKTKLPTFASDFQCFVCGAIFTTDEDRKHHLEKEALGILLASSDQEMEIAKSQEAINENRRHFF
jgi:5-methylcytosine-specific restriction endonuclease McrA